MNYLDLIWVQFLKTPFNIGLVQLQTHTTLKCNICENIFDSPNCDFTRYHLASLWGFFEHNCFLLHILIIFIFQCLQVGTLSHYNTVVICNTCLHESHNSLQHGYFIKLGCVFHHTIFFLNHNYTHIYVGLWGFLKLSKLFMVTNCKNHEKCLPWVNMIHLCWNSDGWTLRFPHAQIYII